MGSRVMISACVHCKQQHSKLTKLNQLNADELVQYGGGIVRCRSPMMSELLRSESHLLQILRNRHINCSIPSKWLVAGDAMDQACVTRPWTRMLFALSLLFSSCCCSRAKWQRKDSKTTLSISTIIIFPARHILLGFLSGIQWLLLRNYYLCFLQL